MLIRRSPRNVLFYVAPLLISFFLWGNFVSGARALTTEEEKKMGKRVLAEN